MNMCSVRQRPIPSAPNSRALAASSGVSAFARTLRRRTSSAQPRIVSKFSLICGGTRSTSSRITLPVAAVDRDHVALGELRAADRERPAREIDREPLAARDARLSHPARDDGGVRGHPAVRGEDALGLDEAVDVVRRRLAPDQDHVLARPPALLGRVGIERDQALCRAGRRVQPFRRDLVLGVQVDHRVEELVELRAPRSARSPPRGR